MKKITFLLAILPIIAFSQVLNTQTALPSQAERHLQFKVSDAPNDVMEILNQTSQNNQFGPTIWVHKESSNAVALALSAHITSAVDYGTTPIINIIAGRGIFDNSAPNTSNFPWGNSGTTLSIQNRPIFAVSNAYASQLLLAANGNFGIGTTTPSARLHNVGSVKFENLSNITSKCPLYIDVNTNEVGKLSNINCIPTSQSKNYLKNDISNSLNIIKNIKTAELNDGNNKYAVIEESEYQNMDSENIIPYLIESIKELNTKIEDLENQLNSKNNVAINSNVNFKISPNPVKDILNIYFDNSESKNYTINIYDTLGNRLVNRTGTSTNGSLSINLANLATGIYVYEVMENGNKASKKGKMIKE